MFRQNCEKKLSISTEITVLLKKNEFNERSFIEKNEQIRWNMNDNFDCKQNKKRAK